MVINKMYPIYKKRQYHTQVLECNQWLTMLSRLPIQTTVVTRNINGEDVKIEVLADLDRWKEIWTESEEITTPNGDIRIVDLQKFKDCFYYKSNDEIPDDPHRRFLKDTAQPECRQ